MSTQLDQYHTTQRYEGVTMQNRLAIAAGDSECYFIVSHELDWQLSRTLDRILSLHPFHAEPRSRPL